MTSSWPATRRRTPCSAGSGTPTATGSSTAATSACSAWRSGPASGTPSTAPSWTSTGTGRSTGPTSPSSASASASPSDRPAARPRSRRRRTMLRYRLRTARLTALALGAWALTGRPAPAQSINKFADATAGATRTTFSAPAGGTLLIRVPLHGLAAAGDQPDAQGRILPGTLTRHDVAPGTVTPGAVDPNPLSALDSTNCAVDANGCPLIDDDPPTVPTTATLTVTPVPEPIGVLAACAAAAALVRVGRRIRPDRKSVVKGKG